MLTDELLKGLLTTNNIENKLQMVKGFYNYRIS